VVAVSFFAYLIAHFVIYYCLFLFGSSICAGSITNGEISDYFRFSKAYPKAEISADIDINGTLVNFSTGAVDYTYIQYLGPQKVTFEVYISSMNDHQLSISNVIPEEPL